VATWRYHNIAVLLAAGGDETVFFLRSRTRSGGWRKRVLARQVLR